MAEIIQVQCYKCQTVYEVQTDMAGQLVECAVCSVTFAVPAPIPGRENQIHATFPYVNFNETSTDLRPVSEQDMKKTPAGSVAGHDTEDTAVNNDKDASSQTKTVKLSRSNIGMIPKVDGAGAVEEKTYEQPAKAAAVRKKQDEFTNSGQASQARPVPAKSVVSSRKWWQFWR